MSHNQKPSAASSPNPDSIPPSDPKPVASAASSSTGPASPQNSTSKAAASKAADAAKAESAQATASKAPETTASVTTTMSKKPEVNGADRGKSVSYTEKTDRIQAISQLIRSLQPLIWGGVILVVVIPLVGKFLLANSIPEPGEQPSLAPTEVVVAARPDLSRVDGAIADAIQAAHDSAEAFAAAELEDWQAELTPRVDNFLDWYFDYFNQKKLEFSAPFAWLTSAAAHQFNGDRPTANEAVAERFTEAFQREFAKRVLVPRNAQIKLEILTTEMVDLYLAELKQNMAVVQNQYHIPQGQWDRYLNDISTTIYDTEGNISTLSLKVLVGGSSYLLAKPLVLGAVGKIGSKLSAKFASQAAAKMAAKTGGVVAAEFGTTLVDPIVGVGILIWDFWDYNNTVTVERPLLKANLLDYLGDVRRSILTNPETGVMTAINQLEAGLLASL